MCSCSIYLQHCHFQPRGDRTKGSHGFSNTVELHIDFNGDSCAYYQPWRIPIPAPDLFGTFLATNGTNFQLNSMTLTGELIGKGRAINVLGSSTTPPFTNITHEPCAPIPEPSTLLTFGTGLVVLAETMRRKLKVGT